MACDCCRMRDWSGVHHRLVILNHATETYRKPHNNLRITRILKCLSELGLERLNAGFLLHVLNEQSENDKLNSTSLRQSMDQWWTNCIRDDLEREWVGQMITKVRSGGTFTREMYETTMAIRGSTGRFSPRTFN